MPLRPLSALLVLSLCASGAAADGYGSSIPMGRCVGSAPASAPPAQGAPLDFRAPQSGDALKSLESIGCSMDDKTGFASDPQGRPVTQAYLDWLQAPADFSQERVPPSLWNGLMMGGYRLDETTCLLAVPGGAPLTRWSYYLFRDSSDKSFGQREAVEVLKTQLEGLPASETVPESVRRRMEQLERAGSGLPPDLRGLLENPGLTVGALSKDADAAYLEQTRFFDGQASAERLQAAAQPVSWTSGTPSSHPGRLLPDEQKLGDVLAGDAVQRFSGTQSGRELMSRFTGKDGTVRLPTLLVLKANQRPDDHGEFAAYYNSGYDTLVLNHWYAESSLLGQLPSAERARVEKSLSDPKALSLYLEGNPKVRAAVLGDVDEILYHELVHAWQDRRSRLDAESLRGNLPPYSLLDKEHEAFREQCRYDFDKAKAEPDALMRSAYMPMFLPMLKSYDAFADEITRIYSEGFSGVLPLKTIAQIQKERESASRTLAASLYDSAVEKLKLAGMWHGDEAMADEASDYAAREKRFRQAALPAMVAQAVGPLPDSYEKEGRRDWAKTLLDAVDPAAPGRGAGLRGWIAASKPDWSKPPKGQDSGQLEEISYAVKLAQAGVVPADAEVAALYLRDVRLYVAQRLGAAGNGKRGGAAALDQARIWAASLPAGDPLRVRVDAAVKAGAP